MSAIADIIRYMPTQEALERFRDRRLYELATKTFVAGSPEQVSREESVAAIMARNGTLEWFARQARARMEGPR